MSEANGLGTITHNTMVDTHEEAMVKVDKGLEAAIKAMSKVLEVCEQELSSLPDIKFNTSLSDTRNALVYTINEFKHHLTTVTLP